MIVAVGGAMTWVFVTSIRASSEDKYKKVKQQQQRQ